MPSKRFDTTTEQGLRAIVARRGELESRAVIAERMRQRKIGNTKTSIVFGFDKDDWQTDAQMRQKDILAAKPRDIAKERREQHEMKMHLKFHTNISFGGEGEPIDYTQDSKLADPTGHIHEYTGVLNKEVEKFIKQSSLYFGNDQPIWKSVATEGMENILKAEKRDIAQEMRDHHEKKMHLKFHTSIKWGDDTHDWTTDYQRGYQPYTTEQQQSVRGSLAKDVKADLRKCHFELGHDKPVWETDVMRSHWKIADHIAKSGRNPADDRENAKKLKAALQKCSFSIGNDPEYM
ncbi:hypothetical protein TrCOL_g7775 [Triparma columacea]|jgi:hypothetical protein|uniref:Uncharacterized protein n=1 Tax=Triparma columacea TaxID=722753 RepID=A0A9W7GGV8_9STRA|nr:hypothetical protein TrCOL_g7775 [Triparma columacea]